MTRLRCCRCIYHLLLLLLLLLLPPPPPLLLMTMILPSLPYTLYAHI
jgi:hypothetical protein